MYRDVEYDDQHAECRERIEELEEEVERLTEQNLLLAATNNGLRLPQTTWDGQTWEELIAERDRLRAAMEQCVHNMTYAAEALAGTTCKTIHLNLAAAIGFAEAVLREQPGDAGGEGE